MRRARRTRSAARRGSAASPARAAPSARRALGAAPAAPGGRRTSASRARRGTRAQMPAPPPPSAWHARPHAKKARPEGGGNGVLGTRFYGGSRLQPRWDRRLYGQGPTYRRAGGRASCRDVHGSREFRVEVYGLMDESYGYVASGLGFRSSFAATYFESCLGSQLNCGLLKRLYQNAGTHWRCAEVLSSHAGATSTL